MAHNPPFAGYDGADWPSKRNNMDPGKLKKSTSTGGITSGHENAPAPGPIKGNGQHDSYWVLSEEERAKGFVRPVRTTYIHIGPPGPKHPMRELTDSERERYAKFNYAMKEEYPPVEGIPGSAARYWTQEKLNAVNNGCGAATTIRSMDIAETYARDPKYYGSTFCVGCKTHLPVNEFVWQDVGPALTPDRLRS